MLAGLDGGVENRTGKLKLVKFLESGPQALSRQMIVEANKMTKQPWVNILFLCSGFQNVTHRNYRHD